MGIPEISSHDGTTKIRSIKPWRHFKQLKKTLLKTNLLFLRVFSESIIVYVHDIHVCVIHQFMEYYILFVVGILTEKLGYFCEQSFLISGNSYVIKHYIVLISRSWNMVIRLRMNLFLSENKKTIENTNYLILRRLYEERLLARNRMQKYMQQKSFLASRANAESKTFRNLYMTEMKLFNFNCITEHLIKEKVIADDNKLI